MGLPAVISLLLLPAAALADGQPMDDGSDPLEGDELRISALSVRLPATAQYVLQVRAPAFRRSAHCLLGLGGPACAPCCCLRGAAAPVCTVRTSTAHLVGRWVGGRRFRRRSASAGRRTARICSSSTRLRCGTRSAPLQPQRHTPRRPPFAPPAPFARVPHRGLTGGSWRARGRAARPRSRSRRRRQWERVCRAPR